MLPINMRHRNDLSQLFHGPVRRKVLRAIRDRVSAPQPIGVFAGIIRQALAKDAK